jgi:hypothetical protein
MREHRVVFGVSLFGEQAAADDQEVGRHLKEQKSRTKELEGKSGEAWIQHAEALFGELGLEIDPARRTG